MWENFSSLLRNTLDGISSVKNSTTRLAEKQTFVHHFSHFLTTTLLISSHSSSQTRRLKTLYLPLESRETRIISREGIRVFFFFFWNVLCRLTLLLREKISRERSRSEIEESPWMDSFLRKEGGRERLMRGGRRKSLLKSPFMVLESSLESQSTFVFAIHSLSLFAILRLPSTICPFDNLFRREAIVNSPYWISISMFHE